MNLIDPRQVLTQILGFLILMWMLRKFAWGPVLAMLEARREKIAGQFREVEKRQADAEALKAKYEQEMKSVEAIARQRIQESIAEGQKIAAEIKAQANVEATQRLERAADEIARERDKAKEILKEQIISLSMRSAEKVLRQKLDDPAQRKLAGEFIDELGALR